jgi:uncharacterized membrane protein YkvA (DUF1232 family)
MVTSNDANFSGAASVASVSPEAEPHRAAASALWVRQRLGRAFSGATEALGQRYLHRLTKSRGSVRETMSAVPERMQRTAQQARLVLELLDDVRSGTYRDLSWYSLPVAAAALLYTINPADVVPDVIPFIGTLDDVALVALAVRVLRNDLRAYCRFKGYPESQYFDLPS